MKINTMTEQTIIDHDGTIQEQVVSSTYNIESEPPYVKMYLDTLLYLKDLPKSHNPVLLGILQRLPWANANEQYIAINAGLKRQMAEQLSCSVSRINNAITDFVKGELLTRVDTGLYMVNPHLFGRGEWKDIKRLRMQIDFDAQGKTIRGVIQRKTHVGANQLDGQLTLDDDGENENTNTIKLVSVG